MFISIKMLYDTTGTLSNHFYRLLFLRPLTKKMQTEKGRKKEFTTPEYWWFFILHTATITCCRGLNTICIENYDQKLKHFINEQRTKEVTIQIINNPNRINWIKLLLCVSGIHRCRVNSYAYFFFSIPLLLFSWIASTLVGNKTAHYYQHGSSSHGKSY